MVSQTTSGGVDGFSCPDAGGGDHSCATPAQTGPAASPTAAASCAKQRGDESTYEPLRKS